MLTISSKWLTLITIIIAYPDLTHLSSLLTHLTLKTFLAPNLLTFIKRHLFLLINWPQISVAFLIWFEWLTLLKILVQTYQCSIMAYNCINYYITDSFIQKQKICTLLENTIILYLCFLAYQGQGALFISILISLY